MDGYTKKEYIRFEKVEEDEDEETEDWESSRSKVKYTRLEEEDFDE